jgi:pyrrolidone-carboxylate peptidase
VHGGFMHLCGVAPEPASTERNATGLPLAAMVDGVAIALATAAQLSQR